VKKIIDIIVPIRNEENNIPVFVENINCLKSNKLCSLQIIFVEDGSFDGTKRVLRKIVKGNNNIKYYCLKKGYGQGAAISFGIYKSNADAVIMMDIDESHPTEVIPVMVEHYINGFDIVQGVRNHIKDRKFYRNFGSKVFGKIFRLIINDGFTDYFRLISKSIAKELVKNNKFQHTIRFNKGIMKGYKQTKVIFSSSDRVIGQSKYDFFRLARFGLDVILSVISKRRLFLLMTMYLIIGLVIYNYSQVFVLAIFFIPALFLLLRYIQISTTNLIDKCMVIEKGA
jgi:polyisoprenyl-phosphate glycosyltransferase